MTFWKIQSFVSQTKFNVTDFETESTMDLSQNHFCVATCAPWVVCSICLVTDHNVLLWFAKLHQPQHSQFNWHNETEHSRHFKCKNRQSSCDQLKRELNNCKSQHLEVEQMRPNQNLVIVTTKDRGFFVREFFGTSGQRTRLPTPTDCEWGGRGSERRDTNKKRGRVNIVKEHEENDDNEGQKERLPVV